MIRLWKPLSVGVLLLLLLAAAAPQMAFAQSGAAQSGATTAGTCGQTYTVLSGDTLSGIAVKCGVNYSALLNANTQLTNVNLIFPGDVVNMPSVAANNAAGGTTTTTGTTTGGSTSGGTTANNGGSIPNTGNSSGSASGNSTGNSSGNTTSSNNGNNTGNGTSGNTSGNSSSTAQATSTPQANNTGSNTSGSNTTGSSSNNSGSTGSSSNGSTSGNNSSSGNTTSSGSNNTGSVPNTGSNASGRTYTVVSGDSMSSIAAAYGVTLADLENANPNISNYNLIFVGDVINLPNDASSSPNTGSIPNTGGSGRTYTIQSGDTLTSIAAQYNTTIQALVNANPSITNSDLIFAGQVINLP